MSRMKELKPLVIIAAVFIGLYYLPMESARFTNSIFESLHLAKWYAQEHVLLCLVPAFFIAGAISVFISQASVIKYLGNRANKVLAYSVAAVSGSVLAVCSCTILPLFSGIYRMGAGLGPATAFLYAGPAVNVLAIILTARILGPELGIARALGAVVFSIVIGLVMHFLFRDEEDEKSRTAAVMPEDDSVRPLYHNVFFLLSLIGILVFANIGASEASGALWNSVHGMKWAITGGFAVLLALVLVLFFGMKWWKMLLAAITVLLSAYVFSGNVIAVFVTGIIAFSAAAGSEEGENRDWLSASWDFAKQIMPLLLFGVILAGALLGRPGGEGLIPSSWVSAAVGGNSLMANFAASFAGAFMYFATLTEVPILQGLIGNGMGKGPALALLLAGPALSLPNMLVIRSVIGTKKTAVFVTLVVVMATLSGYVYGMLF